MKIRSLMVFLIAVSIFSCQEKETATGNEEIQISVSVDFGSERPPLEKTVQVKASVTALEALQYAFATETHPVGKYVFVKSIEGVANIAYEKAWYYKVNNVSPKVLAINRSLNDGDNIRWIYKADVCSKTKDAKSR